jgi:hypothetical protein
MDILENYAKVELTNLYQVIKARVKPKSYFIYK